jgi:hypothetical protein
MQTRINREKYTFGVIKIIGAGAPKQFENWPRPVFRPRTELAFVDMHGP